VMTRNDLLRGNVDLINHAARLLAALGAAHASARNLLPRSRSGIR
jgi:hypothetical protein